MLEAEKAYLRRIVDAVNEFDNILFEVSNENYYNLEWELSIARFVHEYEKGKPRQHLVMPLDLPDHDYGGVTYGADPKNDHTKSWKTWDLAQLHAKLLAARDLKQPLIYDTDGIESNDNPVQRKGFWTAFASGGHVDYTDYSFQPEIGGDERGLRRAELRRQLGHLADFTRQVHFWEMHPADLIRSGDAYALASQREAVLYLPQGGNVDVDLEGMPGSLRAKWFNPRNGLFSESFAVTGGKTRPLPLLTFMTGYSTFSEEGRPVTPQSRRPGQEPVLDAYSRSIGQRRHELTTVALILDLNNPRQDIENIAAWTRTHSKVRRQNKAQKCVEIARLQVAAGAAGIGVPDHCGVV